MIAELLVLIRGYVAGVWQRRWMALLSAWVVCVVGWMAVASLPNRYEGEARIYVDTQTILAPLMTGLAIYPDIQTQVSMMKQTLLSRPNVEQLVRMTDLDLNVTDELGFANLVDDLSTNVSVVNEGRDLFRVAYTDTDPETAYRVVDAVLQIFVEQNVGDTQRDVEDARTFIDRQIADYEAELRDAELKVAEFKRENAEELGGFERSQRELANGEQGLRILENELEAAVWRRDQVRLQLGATPKVSPLGNANALSPQAALAQDRLRTLQQELDQLLLVYTDQHPNVALLRNRIASAQTELSRLIGTTSSPSGATNPMYIQLESELSQAENAVIELERRITQQQREIERLNELLTTAPSVEANLTRLTRDYDVLLNQYNVLIQRREQAQLAKRIDNETRSVEFRIIDPPRVPLQPVGPPHAILHTLVLMMSLAVGVGVALLHLLLADTYLNIMQMRDDLSMPVLGGIRTVRTAYQRNMRLAWNAGFAAVLLALFGSYGAIMHAYQSNPGGFSPSFLNGLLT